MEFTHIQIKKIIKNRKYVAEFTVDNGSFKVETSIGGDSIEECIKKTESFLDVKLSDKDYTVTN